ncbi:MAG: hypothetical protein KTU85_10945 [Acidimicrobiia bacterium]|nr:hypothetical protein [Acidimicrobiia bacterium]MCY4457844.1 hypothetical protein [Acidimicrobiaceae bacterium]
MILDLIDLHGCSALALPALVGLGGMGALRLLTPQPISCLALALTALVGLAGLGTLAALADPGTLTGLAALGANCAGWLGCAGWPG